MDLVVKITPKNIYIIGFTHSSTGNNIGDILTVKLICASEGYPIFG